MLKPGTNRHLLKPSLHSSFSWFSLILYLFSHQTWLGLFCCCWCSSVLLLLLLYVESSSSLIVPRGAEPHCAEPLPLFILILKPTPTSPTPQNILFMLLAHSWVAQDFFWELNLTRNQPEPLFAPSSKQKRNLNLYFEVLSGTWIKYFFVGCLSPQCPFSLGAFFGGSSSAEQSGQSL